MTERNWNIHQGLLYGTLLLLAFGLVMGFNASLQVSQAKFKSPHYLFYKQMVFAALGIVLLFFVIQVPMRILRNKWVIGGLLAATFVMLAAVFAGPAIKGSQRWIHLAGLSFQPSELAKIIAVVFLAGYLSRHGDLRERPLKHLLRMGLVLGPMLFLIIREPDLGNTVMISGVTLLMWFFAGLPWRYILGAGALAAVVLAAAIAASPYMQKRLQTYLDPSAEEHSLGRNYQINQSLIAVAHSGFWGLGLGQSSQKLFFLPEPHNDFIYAVLAEELGFLGCAVLAALFLYIFVQGIRVSLKNPDHFSRWLGVGLVSMVIVHALINTSMVIALGPTKGIPLPFISMGGTVLLMNLVAMGLVINISREEPA